MGFEKFRENVSGSRGGGRWASRAEVKASTRRSRRATDKAEADSQFDEAVSEATEHVAEAFGPTGGTDPLELDLEEVTRFEVIDHAIGEARALVRYGVRVEMVLQDDGRTLKVFLAERNAGD